MPIHIKPLFFSLSVFKKNVFFSELLITWGDFYMICKKWPEKRKIICFFAVFLANLGKAVSGSWRLAEISFR